jgi:hypothetical protein
MAIENEESGSVQQGRQIHITVDSLTITIPSASVTLVVTQRELDTTTPQPDSGEQPAGRVAPLDSRALRQYIDDLNLGSRNKEARELARAKLVQRALDEWNYLRGPLEEALFHPRSREQLEKLAQQYPDYVIFTRRQGTLLLCQDFLLEFWDHTHASRMVIRGGTAVRHVHTTQQQPFRQPWALMDIFAPYRSEYDSYGEFGSQWQAWVDDVVEAAERLKATRNVSRVSCDVPNSDVL